MAQRSRKRGRREGAATTPGEPLSTPREGAAPTPGEPRSAPPGDAPPATGEPRSARPGNASPASRSEQRAAEVRAGLTPLAEGERPKAVTVGAIVAVALAALIVVGEAAGARIGGRGSLSGALLLAAVLLAAAWGMWRVRYWAVLGFEALLAFQIIVAALSLAVASNLWAVVLCVAVIGLGGWLFWKLVRVMARIQMPERRRSA